MWDSMEQLQYADTHGMDEMCKPITLKMKKGTWEVFKQITPRGIKLNDAIMQLIHEKIVKETEEMTSGELDKAAEVQQIYDERRVAKKKRKSKKS